MLQKESRFEVADNSGAESVCCFTILGGTRKRYLRAGDVFIGSVKKAKTGGTVKKGDVVRAVVVRQKSAINRKDGSKLRFDGPACVIIDTSGNPKGTRIFGPIAREVRDKGFVKISSLAPEVV
jgi:large subunit ribosomal protein L14